MKEQFRQYIINLYHDIPQEVYEGLLSIFCIGLVVFIAWKGFKTGLRYSAPLLLVEYIFLLFCSTDDRPDLLIENIMNTIVFIPVGMILGSLLRVKGSWTSQATKSITWLVALLIGCSISITVEALQFFFMRGFSEVDDVMHNTLGCLIGWCMVKGYSLINDGKS